MTRNWLLPIRTQFRGGFVRLVSDDPKSPLPSPSGRGSGVTQNSMSRAPEFTERRAADEVGLDIEGVVDGRMRGWEILG